MPNRIARSSVASAAPKAARKKGRKRNLDAYAIASHSITDKTGVRKNRLGEFLDEGPRKKRQRAAEDEDDEDSEDEDGPAKRRKADGDAGVEEGSDSSGNEWTLGGLAEDDDDSDLDSDEAFGESDEERFDGFAFRGSSSARSKKTSAKSVQRLAAKYGDGEEDGEIDLNDDGSVDDVDEDGLGDEGVDLATMLDEEDDEMLSNDESASDEEDSESDSGQDDDDDDDQADEERVARMRDRLEALDPGSHIALPTSASKGTTLTVDDLLADVDPALRKQFSASVKTRKRSERPKTLSAPLPKVQQDRLAREVATEKATEQLDRWRDTVIHNRRADFLSFPLKHPDQAEPVGKDKFIQGAPQTELEESIQKIMEDSGMVSKAGQTANPEDDVEAAIMKGEELAEKKLPLEEVMRRRAELRKARELLFREEIKAKRIAKIKSKAYRRVHRKERERLADREREEREIFGLGPDEDEKERADRRRVEERMGAKHRDSKWARSLKATNRTIWDEGARDGVLDLARRKEELRRRIEGREVEGGEDSEMSSEDENGELGGDEGEQMLRQLDRLTGDERAGAEDNGLGGMKFMRTAERRRRAQNDEDVERLRKDLAIEDGDEGESEDGEDEEEGLGRAIFGPAAGEKKRPAEREKRPEMEEGDLSEDEGEEVEVEVVTEKPPQAGTRLLKKSNVASGPLSKHAKPDGRDPYAKASENDDLAAVTWLTAPTKESRKDRRRAREMEDGRVMIDTSTLVAEKQDARPKAQQVRSKHPPAPEALRSEASAENTAGWTTVSHQKSATAADNERDMSDSEPSNPVISHEEQQAIYHARAFAGDSVRATFAAEKAAAVTSDDDKESSTHLPGWGSWTGSGLSKSLRAANARQRHNPLYKTKIPGVKPADRKDANLENVIISEKRERKGAKYKADLLPRDFERKEQYESSLRLPVGPEWSTKEVFQRQTRPRVVVKPGVVVEAMERPLL